MRGEVVVVVVEEEEEEEEKEEAGDYPGTRRHVKR